MSTDASNGGQNLLTSVNDMEMHSLSQQNSALVTTASDAREGQPSNQNEAASGDVRIFKVVESPSPRAVEERPDSSRTFWRKLRGIHLFMISINGTLGTGLYGRSGSILELGGPVAVVVSYLAMGILAWAVMQCITELLVMWPIPGALSVFVRRFVDDELGIAVGVAYWFTYSVGFSALIASAAEYFNYWEVKPGVMAAVIYIVIPLILIAFNTYDIGIYGWIEVATGTVKISFLVIVLFFLVAINARDSISDEVAKVWNTGSAYDDQAAASWPVALMMCLSIAAFSYVGVEIIAASAVEARWRASSNPTQSSRTSANGEKLHGQPQPTDASLNPAAPANEEQKSISDTIIFTAAFVPFFVTIAYVLGGLLVSLRLEFKDCNLPKLAWINKSKDNINENRCDISSSPFVIIAAGSDIKGLGTAFNFFILFTVLACANTNLYVASRTLAGLTYRLTDDRRLSRWLRWFGRTDERKVPFRAMVFSAFAFAWVPFLQLETGSFDASYGIRSFIEILAQFCSTGVIIVWACLCLAYIRYYRCIRPSYVRDVLEHAGIHPRQYQQHGEKKYPYRSHWQPLVAYLALIFCLVILVLFNGAFLWNQKESRGVQFLTSYLPVLVFLALWAALKIVRGAKWSFVKLDEMEVKEIFEQLKELRVATFEHNEEPPQPDHSLLQRTFWFVRAIRR